MTDTKQEEGNSFIAWLKWLLGLDENTREEDVYKKAKKVYEKGTNSSLRGDYNISKSSDLKNLGRGEKEDIKKSMEEANAIDLFEKIREGNKSLKEYDDKILEKQGEIRDKEQEYNKVVTEYDNAVKYKTKEDDKKVQEGTINKKGSKITINRLKSYQTIRNLIEKGVLNKEDILALDKNNDIEVTTDKGKRQNRRKEEAKKFLDGNDEKTFDGTKITKEDIANYLMVVGIATRDEDKDENRKNTDKAFEEIVRLDDEYDKLGIKYLPDTSKIKELGQNGKNLADRIVRLENEKTELEKKRQGEEKKLDENTERFNTTVPAELQGRLIVAGRVMDASPNKIKAKEALDMVNDYKPGFKPFMNTEERKNFDRKQEAEKELKKRRDEGLCGTPEELEKKLGKRQVKIMGDFLTERNKLDVANACSMVYNKYKDLYNGESKGKPISVEKQFELMEKAIEAARSDNSTKADIYKVKNEEAFNKLEYQIKKDKELYIKSKEAYLSASIDQANNYTTNILKDKLKKEKEIKKEERNENKKNAKASKYWKDFKEEVGNLKVQKETYRSKKRDVVKLAKQGKIIIDNDRDNLKEYKDNIGKTRAEVNKKFNAGFFKAAREEKKGYDTEYEEYKSNVYNEAKANIITKDSEVVKIENNMGSSSLNISSVKKSLKNNLGNIRNGGGTTTPSSGVNTNNKSKSVSSNMLGGRP